MRSIASTGSSQTATSATAGPGRPPPPRAPRRDPRSGRLHGDDGVEIGGLLQQAPRVVRERQDRERGERRTLARDRAGSRDAGPPQLRMQLAVEGDVLGRGLEGEPGSPYRVA